MSRRRPRLIALVVTLLVVATAACGGEDDDDASDEVPPTSTTTASTTTTVPTTTTTAADPVPELGAIGLRLTEVARLDQPLAMAMRTGVGPPYIAEKGGRVRLLDGGTAPVLDISRDITTGNEQGLLGMTFSPDGRYLYVAYTDGGGDERLDEFTMGTGPRDIDLGSRRNLVTQDDPAPNHNGGNIVFGPDGLLWWGLGDGGGSGDRFGNAQNVQTILGDIVRIRPRPSGADPYGTPPDNPFANGGGRPEIAVSGVRNPWRFSFDRKTGDLWIGDVGQNRLEEISVLPAGRILGANLGWPYFEGRQRFNNASPPAGLTPPIFDYGRGEGQSVAGGYVYRGDKNPTMRGAYVFADTYTGVLRLLALHPDGDVDHRDTGIKVPGALVASFGEDAAGELYVMSLAGGVYRLDPA
jgi:glucose/arabinose dehydrogenase